MSTVNVVIKNWLTKSRMRINQLRRKNQRIFLRDSISRGGGFDFDDFIRLKYLFDLVIDCMINVKLHNLEKSD